MWHHGCSLPLKWPLLKLFRIWCFHFASITVNILGSQENWTNNREMLLNENMNTKRNRTDNTNMLSFPRGPVFLPLNFLQPEYFFFQLNKLPVALCVTFKHSSTWHHIVASYCSSVRSGFFCNACIKDHPLLWMFDVNRKSQGSTPVTGQNSTVRSQAVTYKLVQASNWS